MVAPRIPIPMEPLMAQALRTDFPASMEREIVDGAVRERHQESARLPGMAGLFFVLLLGLLAACLVVKWLVFGFP